MSKLFTLASVNGASLSGANLKASLVSLWNALQAAGVTDSTRTTVTATATLTLSQCGILLVDCTAGSVVLTLPTSGTTTDEAEYRIRRIDSTTANTLTVQRGGTDTVEGSATGVIVSAGGQVDLKMPAGAVNWRVVNRVGGIALQVASATTTNIGINAASCIEITGTTTITGLGANYASGPRFLRFIGALTLTHNATTLNLPGGVNILTAAGDTCIATPNSSGDGWNITAYQTAGLRSMVRLHTSNGYGSTSTCIRRFTTSVTSQGADITYADSATLGASFTINNAGVYAISFTDTFSGVSNLGISLNTSQPATGVSSITTADRLALATTSGADAADNVGATLYLPAGAVIRPHTQGAASGATPAHASFCIARVA